MKDLIEQCRQHGEVVDVHAEVSPEFEAAAIVAEVQAAGNQVVVFHRISGFDMQVVANLYGDRARLRRMLRVPDGMPACAALDRYIAECQSPSLTSTCPAGEEAGTWQETTLSALPVLTHHEEDAGAYITTGIVIVRDPDSGVHNLSFHRGLRVSDKELRISIGPRHDLGRMQARAEARGQALEVAMLVGVSGPLFLAACTSIPEGADELALASCIAGRPIAMRPSGIAGLAVPAETQIVIEGRILPGERRPEAPFGEWMGYYMPEKQSHVFEVTRVERRTDACFHALLCGSNDDLRPLELSTAARIYKTLSAQFPGVLDVVCHPNMLCTVIQLRPEYEGQARQVLMAAVAAHFFYSKMCIVVDDDVDPANMDDVMWAFLTRARPDQRATVLQDLPGFYRDPHKDHWGRLILDATKPWGREQEFRRVRIPGREQVRLHELLDVPPIERKE
ncbi:MAG: UbiD family decarboxylase [Pigmentiphaga sp.]|uniref:UbiD family decarboxylase n=1 Tax=Pigmentiphaga sp. TaxID=1977564 RepID=UPI0029B8A0A3|nr:UbiD family decarboxylase [Pigmentiphaga sp.]MDX3904877.1 UbiD family decarboxylase [Pigmentiphaga sp.]